jgi:hypothetical protein
MDAAETLLIDARDSVEIPQQPYSNEIQSLRTLSFGLRQLCAVVKNHELEMISKQKDGVRVFQFGATSDSEWIRLHTIACFFHWFGISICNYARLVGFIRGIARGDFVRRDLRDPNNFKKVKASIDKYVEGVSELESVRIWRNKVFAHFAITDPYQSDNVATLDMSVIFPVTFVATRYCVGALSLSYSSPDGSHVSDLPQWSMTEVFESLLPRYWSDVSPNLP